MNSKNLKEELNKHFPIKYLIFLMKSLVIIDFSGRINCIGNVLYAN